MHPHRTYEDFEVSITLLRKSHQVAGQEVGAKSRLYS